MTSQLLTADRSFDEQRVLLQGVSWQQYEGLLATLGDDFPSLRLSYLEATLEIMTNSPEHEELKKIIGMLMEAYFQETQTRFHAIGSATFRQAANQRGLEPDECYCLGQKKDLPDLAIEIVLSSGAIDKLEIYRGLGIPEVWIWQRDRFAVYRLRSTGYELVTASELLPALNLDWLAGYVRPADQFEMVMAFRSALREGADR